MKLRVCDCCNKPIRDELFHHYRYEVRKYWLGVKCSDGKYDLCEDCYERIKAECERDYFYREEEK